MAAIIEHLTVLLEYTDNNYYKQLCGLTSHYLMALPDNIDSIQSHQEILLFLPLLLVL